MAVREMEAAVDHRREGNNIRIGHDARDQLFIHGTRDPFHLMGCRSVEKSDGLSETGQGGAGGQGHTDNGGDPHAIPTTAP